MILRPVSPASPWGPPTTKRPVGFTRMSGSRTSNCASASTGRTTSAITPSRSSALSILSECWVDDDLADPHGAGTLVHDADLRLAVGPEPREIARLAHGRQPLGQAVGQDDRQRHQRWRLVRRVAEHHPLVARAALVH